MADSNALLASLLLGQKQAVDPLQGQRKFGQDLIVKGSSTAPLGSGNPLEGLARALQAGIGGWMARDADQQEKQRNQQTGESLATAVTAKTPEELQAALAKASSAGADPGLLTSIYGQLLSQRLSDERTAQLGARSYQAAGGQIPGGVQTPAPAIGMNYQTILAKGESGGNPQAVNPQSGASGAYQFLPSTWQMVRQQNPDLNLPDNPQQAPPELQAQAEQRFRAANAQALQGSGIPVNSATLYLAHRMGPDGTKSVLSAPPDTPMSLVVPKQWLEQNPDMRTTVGQFVGQAQQRFAGTDGQPQGQTAPQQAPQGAQPAIQAPQSNFDPGAKFEQMGRQAAGAGDYQSATKFQQQAQEERAKFEIARQGQAQGIAMTGAEHDRQQNSATLSPEQALSATFADRMANSAPIIDKFGSNLTNIGAKVKDMLPFGVGNINQTPEYQQAKQARDDFINAQLRRESGAAIAPSEYTNADRQYFPQPGDSPEVLAQKQKNRSLAVEGMKRAAGPSYSPSQQIGAPAAPQAGGGDIVAQARAAIAAGAPRDKVLERLKAQGIPGDGL